MVNSQNKLVGLIVSNWNELRVISRKYRSTDIVSRTGKYCRSLSVGNTKIIAIESGVGIKNARTAANELINIYKPDIIINAGIAGALHPEIEVGVVVVGEWVYSIKKNMKISLSCKLNSKFQNVIFGGILTNNKFVDLGTTKKCLYDKTGASVVDMETWGIAEICHKAGKRLLAVKSVSDTSSDDTPRFGHILNKNSSLKYGVAARYFASNPFLLYKYIQFRYVNMKKAVSSLNDFIIRFLNRDYCE